jgi:signal transduction histidine kinase
MLSHEPRTPLGGIAGLTELRLAEQAGPLPTLLPRALRADS